MHSRELDQSREQGIVKSMIILQQLTYISTKRQHRPEQEIERVDNRSRVSRIHGYIDNN